MGRSRGTQYFQPRRKTNPALVNSVLKLHRIAMQEQERRSPNTGSMRHRHPDACRKHAKLWRSLRCREARGRQTLIGGRSAPTPTHPRVPGAGGPSLEWPISRTAHFALPVSRRGPSSCANQRGPSTAPATGSRRVRAFSRARLRRSRRGISLDRMWCSCAFQR